ncbi:hypothetical protein PFICI_08667 [Pestalotiopsis fici W106-1]|uniref:WSC domain-containing protein n=1 Tax=Pestalotiopsis fici (strain W106-1 / CGMCC3.15140) TaxID=1229662 RepID=W3WYG4_PESFW|nr:uncharacterized protein PFICI_08667 [Pestalotiopsis fici W106-1]ETS78814.1 hypothetical protein PFICI_08667 [Pestalotiopsis fici W106-1]
MKSFSANRSAFLAAVIVGSHLVAASPKPVFSHDPKTTDSCIDWWNNADASRSCECVRDQFSIMPEEFAAWNPSLSEDCDPWRYPLSYCVSTSDRDPPPNATTTTTVTPTPTTTTTSSHVPSPTSWSARGCYPDQDPDFPVLDRLVTEEGGDPDLDIATCEDMCWEASINGTVLFAGVKAGNQCWCSSFIGGESTSDQKKCDTPCAGNEEEICGADDFINVFEPVTTSETPSATRTFSSAVATESDSGAVRLLA